MTDERLRRKPFYLVHDPDGKIMIVKIEGNSLARLIRCHVSSYTGNYTSHGWYIINHNGDIQKYGKRKFLEVHMGYKIIDNTHDIEKLKIMRELVSG